METIPYDKRSGKIWFNGKTVEWKDANIHVLNHGLHYASCVFEGERVYDGELFRLEEHTERLFYSAKRMGIKVPYSQKEINDACKNIVNVQKVLNGYVRPLIWRGSEMMAISAQKNKIHVAIATWEWGSYFDPKLKLKGIKLNISSWRRPAPNTIPWDTKAAGLYMICTLSKHEAEAKGFTDSLMLDHEGNIAEATGANIFFVKDGEVHTPTPDAFLNGLTRQTVIEMLTKMGVKVHERHILPGELEDFSQCWLTGSAAEITPVGQIGNYNFEVGELTQAVSKNYEQLVRE
mgnify:CR=1 FL=1